LARITFRRYFGVAVALVLVMSASAPYPIAAQPGSMRQETGFGFVQKAVPVSRGDRYAVVDVELNFIYKLDLAEDKYPDLRDVVKRTLSFIQDAPDKKRYWELIARDGALQILTEYPAYRSVTLTLVVHPDDQKTYLRRATSTASLP
jgi:hypothetical protein